MERDLAVDGGPDDGPPVRALEVAPHDLVEASVAQHQGLELEAAGAEEVDRLLVLVGEAEGVVVPSEKYFLLTSEKDRTVRFKIYFSQSTVYSILVYCKERLNFFPENKI